MKKPMWLILSVVLFAAVFLTARVMQSARSRLTDDAAPAGPAGVAPPAAAAPFCLVIIPDSQYLTATFASEWNDQIDWIIAHARPLEIKAVLHLGDLVDNSSGDVATNRQFPVAMQGLDKLRAAGVPLILAPGNHDTGGGSVPLNLDNLTAAGLAPQWFSNYPNFGKGWTMGFQNPTNLFGSYLLITNGTQPWLLACLCWQPDQTLVHWASNVVQSHAGIPAIFFEHIFVGQRADGRISSWSDPWSVERCPLDPRFFSPTDLWTRWLNTTRNVFWVASGHEPNDANSSFYSAPANDGHIVTFTLTDFQNWFENGHQGSNYMQLVTIDPAANQARISTFSPTFTNRPLTYSNMNYTFPLRATRRPPLSPWQSKLAESARQHGLALYVRFDNAGPARDLSPFAAPMVNSNLAFQATELGTSAWFAHRAAPGAQGEFVGIPLNRGNLEDMELDQFSRLRQVTVSCWFKTTNTIWSGHPRALVTKFREGVVGDFALVAPASPSALSFITVNTARQRVALEAPTPSPFYDGRWHQVCGVYDGARMYCYYDGLLLATAAQTGEIQSTGNAVCIGSSDGGAIPSWDGWIDEVKILTTAWTAESVSAEHQRVTAMLQRGRKKPAERTDN